MFLSCAFVLLAAVPAWAQITVTGEGKIAATPDMATVVLAVVTEEANAMNALEANSASMSKLIKAVESLGLTKKEIRTDSFQISPRYLYPKDQEPRLVGYTVVNRLILTICYADTLGKVLDSAVKHGANRIDSVQWGFKDPQKLLDQARVAAVMDAKRKATMMANAAGSSLGTLVSMSESSQYSPPRNSYSTLADSTPGGRSVPMEAGTQTLRVTVSVVWNVGPPVK